MISIHPRTLLIFLLALILPTATLLAHEDGELAECLEQPGEPDELGFTSQIKINLGGDDYYLLNPAIELLGAPQVGQPQDLPGHCWKIGRNADGKRRLVGKHYNSGPAPGGAPENFWSSDAENHDQLYWVDVIIDRWTPENAYAYQEKGYVHQHELVKVGDGCFHPRLVAWFRHVALLEFTFDGGPPQFHPGTDEPFRGRNVEHHVHPGIDFSFPPQYDIPYKPENPCAE